MSAPILIAGAGIGGLAAAVALRAAGHETLLIERAADVYWAGAARMTIKADRDVLT